MTITTLELFDPVLLSTDSMVLYTSPAAAKTVVKHLLINNNGTTPVTVYISKVPYNTTETLAHMAYSKAIAGGESRNISSIINMLISENGTLKAYASVANTISIQGAGNQITS